MTSNMLEAHKAREACSCPVWGCGVPLALRTQPQGWSERKVSEATGNRGTKTLPLAGVGVGEAGKVQGYAEASGAYRQYREASCFSPHSPNSMLPA